jgi:hypothetical protein
MLSITLDGFLFEFDESLLIQAISEAVFEDFEQQQQQRQLQQMRKRLLT